MRRHPGSPHSRARPYSASAAASPEAHPGNSPARSGASRPDAANSRLHPASASHPGSQGRARRKAAPAPPSWWSGPPWSGKWQSKNNITCSALQLSAQRRQRPQVSAGGAPQAGLHRLDWPPAKAANHFRRLMLIISSPLPPPRYGDVNTSCTCGLKG